MKKTLVPPVRGLPSLRGWGLMQDRNFTVLSVKSIVDTTPTAARSPLRGGTRGDYKGEIP